MMPADSTSRRRRAPSGPAKPPHRAGLLTWAAAGTVSLGLLGLVAMQLDAKTLAAAAGGLSWTLVGAGVALFVAESLAAALRMHLIAGGREGFLTALRVTAWHGIWLIALPMRLGEVAWVVAMRRAYGWNVPTAVACATVQRLLDGAVLAAFALLTIPAAFGAHEGGAPVFSALTLAAALCLLALAGSATLHLWLRLLAGLVIGAGGRPRGRRGRLLVSLGQARRWLEDVRNRRIIRRCIVPTALAWTAGIAAYWAVGRAVGLDLALAEYGFAAAGSNLAAALPVQSIGGFGLLEAGFTGIAAWFGAAAGTAALAALAIRAALIAGAGLFWAAALTLGGALADGPARSVTT